MSVVREVLGEKYDKYVEAGKNGQFRGTQISTLSVGDLYAMIAKQNELLAVATEHLFIAAFDDLIRNLTAPKAA